MTDTNLILVDTHVVLHIAPTDRFPPRSHPTGRCTRIAQRDCLTYFWENEPDVRSRESDTKSVTQRESSSRQFKSGLLQAGEAFGTTFMRKKLERLTGVTLPLLSLHGSLQFDKRWC